MSNHREQQFQHGTVKLARLQLIVLFSFSLSLDFSGFPKDTVRRSKTRKRFRILAKSKRSFSFSFFSDFATSIKSNLATSSSFYFPLSLATSSSVTFAKHIAICSTPLSMLQKKVTLPCTPSRSLARHFPHNCARLQRYFSMLLERKPGPEKARVKKSNGIKFSDKRQLEKTVMWKKATRKKRSLKQKTWLENKKRNQRRNNCPDKMQGWPGRRIVVRLDTRRKFPSSKTVYSSPSERILRFSHDQ